MCDRCWKALQVEMVCRRWLGLSSTALHLDGAQLADWRQNQDCFSQFPLCLLCCFSLSISLPALPSLLPSPFTPSLRTTPNTLEGPHRIHRWKGKYGLQRGREKKTCFPSNTGALVGVTWYNHEWCQCEKQLLPFFHPTTFAICHFVGEDSKFKHWLVLTSNMLLPALLLWGITRTCIDLPTVLTTFKREQATKKTTLN